MNSTPPYQYQPLLEDDAIRLLVLQPSEDLEAKVECSLVHTKLSECADDVVDHYTALSYVWGDARFTTSVLVRRKPFNVTINLESALRHLRDLSRPRKVWADAICINQANDAEKTRQVSQMGEVYKPARHTIIYLGQSTQEPDVLLHYARSLCNVPGSSLSPLSAQENSTRDWISVLDRPWFRRVWVYQELIFSENPWLQCGRVRVRWNQLCRTIQNTAGLIEMRVQCRPSYRWTQSEETFEPRLP